MSSTTAAGTTVLGDSSDIGGDSNFHPNFSKDTTSVSPKGKAPTRSNGAPAVKFDEQTNYLEDQSRPFFVVVGKGGAIEALHKLDKQLQNAGQNRILSKKKPTDWIGREINPGQLGMINHGGLPKILTRPGRYPGFPLRNWWARKYCGTKGISDNVIQFQGLTIVQVSQNQAAVISDPQNRVFVVKNGGFVALAAEGTYNVLAVVDQTHLSHSVLDPSTKTLLGWTHEVTMSTALGGKSSQFVVALFLNIPASNCAILQRGDDLELLPAGQHCITNPNITLRGMFTLGENQLEMSTKDIFTRDQVPVKLTIYLKWQLTEPLKLTTHGYQTPYDALRDKTQSILTQIVAHLDYSAMVKQRSFGPGAMDDTNDPSAAFLDALRIQAMDEMHVAALEYGIVLKDLAVMDRQFKGEIASTMDKLTVRALQAQVEAANVDRENSNKVKQEEGALSVARIKAQARNTQADADAYNVIAAAKATAEATRIAAEAGAEATRLAAKAEADAIRQRALADLEVTDQFAREMELRRVEVSRVQAFGQKAVFVPTDGLGAQAGNAMVMGLAAGMGRDQRSTK